MTLEDSRELKINIKNCYGIRSLDNTNIDFNETNSALIYAPNGVMKTSLAKVFKDLRSGNVSSDLIYKERKSEFKIEYFDECYENNGCVHDNVFVFNSLSDMTSEDVISESISKLLAKKQLRDEYNQIMDYSKNLIVELEKDLFKKSGKKDSKTIIVKDFKLSDTEWPNILQCLNDGVMNFIDVTYLGDVKYSEIFNDDTEMIFKNPEFLTYISEYERAVDDFLKSSSILSHKFDNTAAVNLGKDIEKNNLFNANHSITLSDGTNIVSLKSWNDLIKKEEELLYSDPKLNSTFRSIEILLNKNQSSRILKNILLNNAELVIQLSDPSMLKKTIWLHYFVNLGRKYEDYNEVLSKNVFRLNEIFVEASQESDEWKKVIDIFNQRFSVPFKIKIGNQSNILLKDDKPMVFFEYSEKDESPVVLNEGEICKSLSTGEFRALHLLYSIFELENIKSVAGSNSKHYLIVADDVADSFDYKNKYAIIEYLRDLSSNSHINLILLTHNFDFYRTAERALNIKNTYTVIKNENSNLKFVEFSSRDVFKNQILYKIKGRRIDTDESKSAFIASIPFYRNLSIYLDISENIKDLLHVRCDLSKDKPQFLGYISTLNNEFNLSIDESLNYDMMDLILSSANKISDPDKVSLVDKIVLSIAIRLKAELFLRNTLIENKKGLDCKRNQTRDWSIKADGFLLPHEKEIIERVNIMTPESIHINSFMYEPIIDMSSWSLIKLYSEISLLLKEKNIDLEY